MEGVSRTVWLGGWKVSRIHNKVSILRR